MACEAVYLPPKGGEGLTQYWRGSLEGVRRVRRKALAQLWRDRSTRAGAGNSAARRLSKPILPVPISSLPKLRVKLDPLFSRETLHSVSQVALRYSASFRHPLETLRSIVAAELVGHVFSLCS